MTKLLSITVESARRMIGDRLIRIDRTVIPMFGLFGSENNVKVNYRGQFEKRCASSPCQTACKF